jgi:hypothetical protein
MQPQNPTPPNIATPDEILETLTAFLRREIDGGGARECLRAAELLGKRFGLFDAVEPDGESGPVIIEGSDRL